MNDRKTKLLTTRGALQGQGTTDDIPSRTATVCDQRPPQKLQRRSHLEAHDDSHEDAVLLPLHPPYRFPIRSHPHRSRACGAMHRHSLPPPPPQYSLTRHSVHRLTTYAHHGVSMGESVRYGRHERWTATGEGPMVRNHYQMASQLCPQMTDQSMFCRHLYVSGKQHRGRPVGDTHDQRRVVSLVPPSAHRRRRP